MGKVECVCVTQSFLKKMKERKETYETLNLFINVVYIVVVTFMKEISAMASLGRSFYH